MRDDLFFRIVFFLAGMFFAGLSIALVGWALNGARENAEIWVAFGAPLSAWGTLLILRGIVPAQWPIARLAEKAAPNPTGIEDLALFLIIICLPAALLTLLRRCIGVNGQPVDHPSRPPRRTKGRTKPK